MFRYMIENAVQISLKDFYLGNCLAGAEGMRERKRALGGTSCGDRYRAGWRFEGSICSARRLDLYEHSFD